MLSTILLSISTSIDSLGIGLTYGIKNTKIPNLSKFILLGIFLAISISSIYIGKCLGNLFGIDLTNIVSSLILLIIGITIVSKALFEHKNQKSYDFNNSNLIDPKEAFILGIALSLDSFGIGVSYGLLNTHAFIFSMFVVMFQFIFLNFGIYFGKKIKNKCQTKNIPDYIWSIISSVIIFMIAIFKLSFN